MFENIFPETQLVSKYYGEYLQYIHNYQNFHRPAIFCRYIRINKAASSYNTEALVTESKYLSGIKFDIYDLTPLYMISELVDEAQDVTDLSGQAFHGATQAVTYTIDDPRIDDLVILKYEPQNSTEIFRVTHIRSAVHATKSTPNLNWTEINLEYAPLIDLSKMSYLNHYAYDLSQERYLLMNDFKQKLHEIKKLDDLLTYLSNKYYDDEYEMYYYILNNEKIIPIKWNRILYDFLATKKNFNNSFAKIKRPFGVNYESKNSDECIIVSNDTTHRMKFTPPLIHNGDLLSFEGVPTILDVVFFINNWKWNVQLENYKSDPKPDVIPGQHSHVDYVLNHAHVKSENIVVDVNGLPSNSEE